jgi:putative ABC transport system permease protein
MPSFPLSGPATLWRHGLTAVRALRGTPGYAAIALLTLALGIGVNTAIFTLIDTVLFRSGPFPHAERLVQITATTRQGELREFAEVEQREIRSQASLFESLTSVGRVPYAVAEPGRPAERLNAVLASAEMFDTFGVPPLIGRPFSAEETQPGKNQVVLLSHGLWQQRYGGRPDVLGRTLRLDGEIVTIIGVMPASFDYPMLWGRAALWRPLNFTHDQLFSRDYRAFQLIGRLAPGATAARIAAGLAPLAAVQQQEHPQYYPGLRYRVRPLQEALMDDTDRRMYWLLLGLAGFVLLIACANLANLQLARATARIRDLAIRAALGASRRRLIAHQLFECVVLAVAGGALGLLVALGLNRFLEQHLLVGRAPDLHLALDGTVLSLTIVLSLVTGVVFGIVPAWLASRVDLSTALKQQARGSTTGRGHHRIRNGLIVAQVALALVLLSGAGMMQRGFARFLQRRTGWDTAHVLTAALPLSESRFDTEPKRFALFRKLERRLAALPGVEHAAICSSLPLENYTGERPIFVEGRATGPSAQDPRAAHVMVTSDYFATLGIPFVEGRNFSPDLKAGDPLVFIVNEALARRLWPGRSALGRRIRSDDSGYITWGEVIGVVRDVETAANFSEPATRLQIYKPIVHEPWGWANLVVRGPAPAALAESLRRAVAEVDPDLAVEDVGTVRQFIEQQQRNLLLVGQTLGGFALLGLVLAAVGLYSVISHTVTQRSGEFGIRLALGAQPAGVLALVLRHGIRLAVLGVVLGLAGAYGLGRFLDALLPRLGGADPIALLGVSAILFTVALIACWLPARRATKVDPMVTLRSE